jgi:hypothetical protein
MSRLISESAATIVMRILRDLLEDIAGIVARWVWAGGKPRLGEGEGG